MSAGCGLLAAGRWFAEKLGCRDAWKLRSLEGCKLIGAYAFELSSLIAFQPPSKDLTLEP
ncbi:MAG: hypothetical protein PVI00_11030 [Desulfobacterales bacterium]